MNKNSFVFYETFESVINDLPEDMQLRFYKYIAAYGLHGTEPEVSGIEKAIWTQIQFAIDEAQSRRKKNIENGNKGGRPVKNENRTITENNPKKPTETQNNPSVTENNRTITEVKPNHNLNVNVNVNGNGNENVNANVNEKVSAACAALPSKRFVKPSVQEIEAYCFERGNTIKSQNFYDFYESKGWKVGNQPMKDWKAAVRTWEQRNLQPRGHPGGMAVDDSITPGKIIM